MIETTLDGKTKNIVKENIEQLKQLFPEIITEDKINFDKLKEILGEEIDDSNERYDFTWKGKHEAVKISQTPSEGTLRPSKEDSKNWDTTENLYIEGDNLEVLKLLQKSYYGKIKMIYLDPPYNTGQDFVYEDDFKDNLKNYLKQDNEGFNVSSNPETSGRYHTNWLNMMYSRLKLARNLLTDEGVIFISIDDSENSNLKKICDEIFGESNFITTICQKSRGGISNDKIISENHNFHLFYAKNVEVINKKRKLYGIKKTADDLKKYNKNDNDGKGNYSLNPVTGPGGARKGNPYYTFLGVTNYWRFSEERMQKMYEEGKIVKSNNNLYQKTYLKDIENDVKTISTWWNDIGTTSNGTNLVKKLFPESKQSIFDHPKPVELIILMITYCNVQENDIILDFFSGSSTTAHAVLQINTDENKKLKFIMVQLPEKTKSNSPAFENGYENICEIAKERIRRAGNKLMEENPDTNIDTGFKVFKLDSSNLTKWNPNVDNLENSLIAASDNIVEGRCELDLIYEIMLKYGIELTAHVEEISFDKYNFYSVGSGSLIICLNNNITRDIAENVLKIKEKLSPDIIRVVFKDNGFESDADKTNVKEILRNNEVDEFITI